MPIALVDTLARITSATILLARFSSSQSRSEHKPAAPIAQRRESVKLLGEKNGQYVNGVPCATRTLDHAGSTDFDGGKARFDGTLGGAEDDAEKSMMGGCYQAPLNAQLAGGTMTWQGAEGWAPKDICVDWMSNNFAWQCSTTNTGKNSWDLVNCHDLTPWTKCTNLTL